MYICSKGQCLVTMQVPQYSVQHTYSSTYIDTVPTTTSASSIPPSPSYPFPFSVGPLPSGRRSFPDCLHMRVVNTLQSVCAGMGGMADQTLSRCALLLAPGLDALSISKRSRIVVPWGDGVRRDRVRYCIGWLSVRCVQHGNMVLYYPLR